MRSTINPILPIIIAGPTTIVVSIIYALVSYELDKRKKKRKNKRKFKNLVYIKVWLVCHNM